MTSEHRRSALKATIESIENGRNTQECIDKTQKNLSNIIYDEMECIIPKTMNKNRNKIHKKCKLYWTRN